jgi:hypothetical protein
LWNLYELSYRSSERFPQAGSLVGPRIRIATMKITISSGMPILSEHKALGPVLPPPPHVESCQSKDRSVLTGE